MNADFWHSCWKNNRLGWHQVDYHPFLQEFLLPRLSSSDKRVFVPLCGKSEDIWWLNQYMNVIGSELNDIACRDLFSEKNIEPKINKHLNFSCYYGHNVTLWQGDFFQLSSQEVSSTDWVYDRAALIALSHSMQKQYVKHLKTFLTPNNQLFLITLEFPENELEGPPFPVSSEDVQDLFIGCEIEEITSRELSNKQFAQRQFNVSYLRERLFIIRKNYL